MKGIIDRFEGEYAVVEMEDRSMKNISRSQIPDEAKEGSAIEYRNGKWKVDDDSTDRLREDINQLAKDLFE